MKRSEMLHSIKYLLVDAIAKEDIDTIEVGGVSNIFIGKGASELILSGLEELGMIPPISDNSRLKLDQQIVYAGTNRSDLYGTDEIIEYFYWEEE